MTSERGIAAPRETPDDISVKFAEAACTCNRYGGNTFTPRS